MVAKSVKNSDHAKSLRDGSEKLHEQAFELAPGVV